MAKQTVFGVIGVLIGVAALGAGGYWLVQNHSRQSKVSFGAASIHEEAITSAESGSVAGASSLNVSGSSGTNNLGQLDTNKSSSGNTSSDSGSSSTARNAFDPNTFAQYDKYKDGTSGLFAEVQKGDGDELTAGKKAAVYYRGWLTNGVMFDQSRTGSDGKLEPFVFTLGDHQVIPGWEQALAGMKVGGVRLVIIPPSVGYGEKGQGSIPGNSVLVFQVQLGAVQ